MHWVIINYSMLVVVDMYSAIPHCNIILVFKMAQKPTSTESAGKVSLNFVINHFCGSCGLVLWCSCTLTV